jgi:regulator of sigma E protease
LSTVLYVIEIAIALGLIILVHELGHFLAAKGFGVWVRRFAIGFGPAIVKWRQGGPLPADGMPGLDDPNRYATEYSLRVLPLGGFVEPMGDHVDGEGGDDPRALWRRPAWQKIVVFSAGVAMNAVLAVVFFTAASMIGVQAPSSLVGDVTPFMAAEKAGIKAGDRIVAINGQPVRSFEDIMTIISSSDAGTKFSVTVERTKDGAAERLTFDDLVSQREPGDMAPRLGIEPALEPMIYGLIPGSPEQQAGLRPGDTILSVDGKPAVRWRQMNALLADAPPGPVTLAIQRDSKQLDLTIDPTKLKVYDLGMEPPASIAGLDPDGPAAKADVRKGDRIIRINDKAWPSLKEVSETIKATGGDKPVRLVLERDGEKVEISVRPAVYGKREEPRIGILQQPAMAPRIQVGWVDPDGPAAKAGLQSGDLLVSLGADSTKPRLWDDVYAVVGKAGGKQVPIALKRGNSELTANLTPAAKPLEKFALLGSKPGPLLYEPLPRIYNPLSAAERGFRRTWTWMGRVYVQLRQLAKGQLSRESMGGPVMIVDISLRVAQRGLGTFLDLWGILSVCIAVFNFLPVPPFDGGHVLFVLLEKIKGSPIGAKVRTWIWGAGWAAVGVLFALIMWQDIARLL